MKKSALLLLTVMASAISSQAEIIALGGVYNGKDLYIKNSMTSSGVGYCIFEVIVNGKVTSDEVNTAVISIDFKALNINMHDPLEIVLRCKEDCPVRVLNPEVLLTESTFQVEHVLMNKNGHLEWSTKNEVGELPYTVEQYKWKRWVPVAETMGHGDQQRNVYTMDLPLHSGTNYFRIVQKDHKGVRTSNEIKVESATPPVQLLSREVTRSIDFNTETFYELHSEYGELVAKGKGKSINVSGFPRGQYFVSFDAQAGVPVHKR